jgi:hypothetical protein
MSSYRRRAWWERQVVKLPQGISKDIGYIKHGGRKVFAARFENCEISALRWKGARW